MPLVTGGKAMRLSAALLAICLAMLSAVSVAGTSVAGKYSDGKLTVDLSETAGALTGFFSMGDQQFPAIAHAQGNSIDGSFKSGGDSFLFTATLDADTLTLSTGGKNYTLKRLASVADPLAQPAPGGANNDSLPGYSAVMTTDFGKALFAQKPGATSVTAALESTLPDLAHYFDARPTIKGAYEDSKSHQSGGAVFTAALKGQSVKGVVSCKLVDKGAAVTITYCRVDAPPAEWTKLTSEPPAAGPVTAPDATKVLGDNARVYQFSDGTGSITLADGWKTQSSSAITPIFIQGPGDQGVFIHSSRNILTPDSPTLKTVQHNQAVMKQMGRNPPPPPFMFVAEFTDPVQATKDLAPQLSQFSQSKGGPATHLDEIVSHQDIPSTLKNGKAAIIDWTVTRTLDGNARHYRGLQTLQMAPIGQGTWMLFATGFTTPVETFDHDRPIIFAMIQSIKVNPEMAAQRMREINQHQMAMIKQMGEASSAALQASHDQFQRDQDQRFADGQARHAAQEEGYARHNQQFRDDQLQKARGKDDQVEHILGYRTVYDTQTGLSTTADLSDVTGVVNSLNAAALDPNRFVQIPLRDQQDPTPGK